MDELKQDQGLRRQLLKRAVEREIYSHGWWHVPALVVFFIYYAYISFYLNPGGQSTGGLISWLGRLSLLTLFLWWSFYCYVVLGPIVYCRMSKLSTEALRVRVDTPPDTSIASAFLRLNLRGYWTRWTTLRKLKRVNPDRFSELLQLYIRARRLNRTDVPFVDFATKDSEV